MCLINNLQIWFYKYKFSLFKSFFFYKFFNHLWILKFQIGSLHFKYDIDLQLKILDILKYAKSHIWLLYQLWITGILFTNSLINV